MSAILSSGSIALLDGSLPPEALFGSIILHRAACSLVFFVNCARCVESTVWFMGGIISAVVEAPLVAFSVGEPSGGSHLLTLLPVAVWAASAVLLAADSLGVVGVLLAQGLLEAELQLVEVNALIVSICGVLPFCTIVHLSGVLVLGAVVLS